jgi:hypothetical protein
MEKVLEVYKRPYNEKRPVVCMDESPKQLIGETKTPIAAKPGSEEKYDYEYVRNGVCNIFMSNEPFRSKKIDQICYTKNKLKNQIINLKKGQRISGQDNMRLVERKKRPEKTNSQKSSSEKFTLKFLLRIFVIEKFTVFSRRNSKISLIVRLKSEFI